MAFLALLLIVFFFVMASKAASESGKVKLEDVIDVPKVCPPHKWYHHEVKDAEGNFVKWMMVCRVCGPLKPSNGPARTI